MNADAPGTWAELWADAVDYWTANAAALLQLDTVGKGLVLALALTTAAALAAAFTTDHGTPIDGPILTESERH